MPLLDHFHQPDKRRLPWPTISQAWAVSLMGWLNRRLPREEYRAEINVHLGRHVEADVAEFREDDVPRIGNRNGTLATATESAPPAILTIPASFPDEIEIEIREEHDRSRLVDVIELISPANKKEREERDSFVAKCVAYLKKGIGVVLIDVVTDRHANLHNELLRTIGGSNPQVMPDSPTYISGYRPVHRRKTEVNVIEIWAYEATVGQTIPSIPLGLRGGPVIVLDLEETYTDAINATGL
jgi:hypothetical protein